MGAPIIYRSTDPGAPDMANFSQPTYEVLRACLIDGYQGKAPAGWSLVHDDYANSGIFTITNAKKTGVMGIVKSSYYQADINIFVADAMIDATHAANARSGRSAITSITDLDSRNDQHRFMHRPSYFYKNWCVIANENFAIVMFGRQPGYLTSVTQSNHRDYGCMMFFGAASNPRKPEIGLGDFAVWGGFIGGAWTVFNTYSQATTYLYGYDGGVSNRQCYGFLYPLSNYSLSYGLNAVDSGSVVNLALERACIFTGESSVQANAYQHFVLPMLMTSNMLNKLNAKTLVLQRFPELITHVFTADRPYIAIKDLAAGSYFFVSMSAGDWP